MAVVMSGDSGAEAEARPASQSQSQSQSQPSSCSRGTAFDALLERDTLKAKILELAQAGLERALLFVGERGSGKKLASRGAAEAFLCLDPFPDGRPCGVCESCRLMRAGTHPDYASLEVEEEGGLLPVKTVRGFISEETGILPSLSKLRVFALDAGALNEQGQNALLKTLEEPPLACVFLLRCEQVERLLPTVRSRVIELSMPPLSTDALEQITRVHDVQAVPGALAPDVRQQIVGGNPGKYLALAQDDQWCEIELLVRNLLLNIAEGKLGLALGKQLDALKDATKEAKRLLFYFMKVYGHELLRRRMDLPPLVLQTREAQETIARLDRHTRGGQEWIADYYSLCEDCEAALDRPLSVELQWAALILKIEEVMHSEK